MRRLFLLQLIPTLLGLPLLAADPLSETEQNTFKAEAETAIAEAEKLLAKEKNSLAAYSHRGDARLFLGQFKESIADFEKMIALDPSQDDPHWRLGISYFCAGEFAKGAAQFEKYHRHDDQDRENGVWHYFCVAKVEGKAAARKKMLEYTRFDRHPFPALYEMYAGNKTPEAVLEATAQRESDEKEKSRETFFAELYVAFYHYLEGQKQPALDHLAKAIQTRWGKEWSGKTYMWKVAVVLWNQWSSEKEIQAVKE